MATEKQISFVVDARCYQDPAFAFRGIGLSTASLLRHCPGEVRTGFRFTGIVSPDLPPISDTLRGLFDIVVHQSSRSDNTATDAAVFFEPSPMTHDPDPIERLLNHPKVFSTTFVHDFIPYDFPDFQSVAELRSYERRLRALALYDEHFANSAYTAQRLQEIVPSAAGHVFVSRIGARAAFFAREIPSEAELLSVSQLSGGGGHNGFFLSVAGEAARKNVECAISGIRELNSKTGKSFRLMIVGSYSPRARARLLRGNEDFVLFLEGLSDRLLGYLYRESVAVVVPSRVEGFSMPVVEGIAAGGCIIASNCDAHRELVQQPEALFDPDDPAELAGRLQRLIDDPGLRVRLRDAQAGVIADLTEPAVAEAFWERLSIGIAAFRQRGPRVGKRAARPSFAFITPYPPQQSGVAIAMAKVAEDLAQHADVDVYTHAAVKAQDHPHLRHLGDLEEARHVSGYDVVLYVLGNSLFHSEIYDLMRLHRRGDHVLVADSLMTDFQFHHHGEEDAIEYASTVLQQRVSGAEYRRWLAKPMSSPLLGYEELFAQNWEFVVHSQVMKDEMLCRGASSVHMVPHPVNVALEPEELQREYRAQVRKELGFRADEMIIASMGIVTRNKGALESVMAIRELTDWGYLPKLVFVGHADGGTREEIMNLAREFQVAEHISLAGDYVEDAFFRTALAAADIGLQLRKVPYGQTSGGLASCIAAGLCTVANDTMARAIDSPDYVLTVPDQLSPILIAERVVEAYELGKKRCDRDDVTRRSYCLHHSFQAFSRGLISLVA